MSLEAGVTEYTKGVWGAADGRVEEGDAVPYWGGDGGLEKRVRRREGGAREILTKMRSTIAAKTKNKPGTAAPTAIVDGRVVEEWMWMARTG